MTVLLPTTPRGLLSFWLLLLTLASCSKDDANPADATGSLSGTISPAGVVTTITATPASGGTAVRVTPDAAGVYAFPNLTAGSYTLTYVVTNVYLTPASQTISVPAGGAAQVPAITVQPRAFGSIRAKISPAGVVSAVTATPTAGPAYTTTVDAAGVYSFRKIPAQGYTLSYAVGSGYTTPRNLSVTVPAGQTVSTPRMAVGTVTPAAPITSLLITTGSAGSSVSPDAGGTYYISSFGLPPASGCTINYNVSTGYAAPLPQTVVVPDSTIVLIPTVSPQPQGPATLTTDCGPFQSLIISCIEANNTQTFTFRTTYSTSAPWGTVRLFSAPITGPGSYPITSGTISCSSSTSNPIDKYVVGTLRVSSYDTGTHRFSGSFQATGSGASMGTIIPGSCSGTFTDILIQ